jgi:hypothetical protein
MEHLGKRVAMRTSIWPASPSCSMFLAGALERPGLVLGGNHALDTAAREDCRQRAPVPAPISNASAVVSKGASWTSFKMVAPNRREHAVVRMDAASPCRHLDAFLAPLVRR